MKMNKYDRVLKKIEEYRGRKMNTLYDDFFNADLDVMVECIEFKKQHDAQPKVVPNQYPSALCSTHCTYLTAGDRYCIKYDVEVTGSNESDIPWRCDQCLEETGGCIE